MTKCGSLEFLVRAADRTQKTLVVLSSIQRVINQSIVMMTSQFLTHFHMLTSQCSSSLDDHLLQGGDANQQCFSYVSWFTNPPRRLPSGNLT